MIMTLDEIHFRQRRLDRLDYLRHQMRKQSDSISKKGLDLKFASNCKIN